MLCTEWKLQAEELSIKLLLLPVNGPDDFFKAFETAKNGHAEALVVVDDALVTRHRVELLDLATKHSLPVVSLFKRIRRGRGPSLAYGPSTPPMYRACGVLRRPHPQGRKAGRSASGAAQQFFELVINLKTAKTLGLEIPATLLARADEVIE